MIRRVLALVAALLAGALLASGVHPGPAVAEIPPHFRATPNNAELRTTLQLTTHSPYLMRPVYALDLGSLKPGEVWQFNSDGEVTSELPYPTMFATALVLSDTPHLRSLTGTERPARAQGTNFTNQVHHQTWSRSATYKVTDPNKHWLVLMAWTASRLSTKGAKIKIERGYGGISAARFS